MSLDNQHTQSFEESVEDYSYEILNLEMELKNLQFSRKITSKQYKQRSLAIQQLKKRLDSIVVRWNSAQLDDQNDIGEYPLPDLDDLTPVEQEFCLKHLEGRTDTIKKAYKSSDQVMKWVRKTMKGRMSGVSMTFYLSGLRRKILAVECDDHELSLTSEAIDRFVKSIEREDRSLKALGLGKLTVLKRAFLMVRAKTDCMAQLEIKAKDEEEKVTWMRRWLKFQEYRMRSYFPKIQIPSLYSMRNFMRRSLSSDHSSIEEREEKIESIFQEFKPKRSKVLASTKRAMRKRKRVLQGLRQKLS